MNRIITKATLLLVVLVLMFFILFRNRSPFGKQNSSFAAEPKKEITRIELNEGGKELNLKKVEDKWLINGEAEARKSAVNFIEKVLKEIKIKSTVAPEIFEKEVSGQSVSPVSVKVYEKRKLLKSYLVYKTPGNVYGNMIKMQEGSKPFIGYVPGFENNIGSVFTVNGLYWKPYTLFNLLPSEIVAVRFENNDDTASSFSIVKGNYGIALSDLNSDISGWDSSLVQRYLSYFTWIPFEAWDLTMSEKERSLIETGKPVYKITVNSAGGKQVDLGLWRKMTGEGENQKTDSDRLYGKTSDIDEFFVIKYFDIDPIIKKRAYFFGE